MKTAIFLYSALVAPFVLASCYQVPVSGRRAINLVDSKEVARMSKEEFDNMKATYRLSKNRAQVDQLQRVGERISSVVPWWDMGGSDWEWVVFDAPNEINAFAMSGGKVGVFSGLYKLIENDDQLASVIAHEIAHVTSRHVDQRLSGVLAGEAITNISGMALGGGGAYLAAAGFGASAPAFDRGKELEADNIGLTYMAEAGYDPREAIKVLEKLDFLENGAQGGKATPNFGDTHPTNPTRMAKMLAAMPEALKIYEAKHGPLEAKSVVK